MQSSEYVSEEDVKIRYLLPFLKQKGYKENCCDFEKTIEVQEGRKTKKIFADVVVYSSSKKETPLLLCETKKPEEILDRRVREQAISYARLLPIISPLALITNGLQVQVFETVTKTRIADLPSRQELQNNLINYLVSKETQDAIRKEAKHELFIIDDVQTFKSVLKSCHNEIRNNEGYDPTIAFDEMAKVLFCKLYEEKHSTSTNRFSLSVFDETLEKLSVNVVRQIFEETKKDNRYSGLFLPETTINLQDRTIRKIISLFENYDLSLTAFDVKGEAFEYFLGDTFTGGLGEYFTPRNVVEFIVEAINPKIGEKIVDIFCGTGGFLIYAFEVVSEKIRLQDFSEEEKEHWKYELSSRSLYGTDWKERTAQACKMNMMVHGDGSAGIFMSHGLVNIPNQIEEGKFDVCFTNPPFGSIENDVEILNLFELGNGRKSQSRLILGLERTLKLIKPGGKVGIVVIDGILNNPSTSYVRDFVKANAHVLAVISLASATFEGYGARAKTSVLILQKRIENEKETPSPTFMALAENTGYAPNGDQISGNQLPDILLAYKAYLRREKEFPNTPFCWTCNLEDRLDVEFYYRQKDNINFDTASVQKQVTKLLEEVSKEYAYIDNSLKTAFEGQEYETLELKDLLQEVRTKEKVENDKTYKLLGVRWWGGGVFIREEKTGREIKGKTLFRMSSGLVVYNRLFAFRGSFAVAEKEHEGCFVSGEFPTFKVKNDVAYGDIVCKYIVHCLNSPKYLAVVDALSTGSTKTSRNRFNQKLFLTMKIDIPKSPHALKTIVTLLDKTVSLRFKQEELNDKMKDLHTSISAMLPYQ